MSSKRNFSETNNCEENKENTNSNLPSAVYNTATKSKASTGPRSLLHDEYNAPPNPIIISLDGNIGAGKSTLLEEIRKACPDYECVVEPVGEWTSLCNTDGKSLLQMFYEDKKRWAYTFQNCAILTRIKALREAIRDAKKKIIITERSVLTDRYVFAEMLRDSGDLNGLEWTLYTKWFDEFACDLPLRGIIYITTGVETSAERIIKRARTGESGIPTDYLSALERQHEQWVGNTDLPVCRISTDTSVPAEQNVKAIVEFIESNFMSDAAAGVATPHPNQETQKKRALCPAVTPAAPSALLTAQ